MDYRAQTLDKCLNLVQRKWTQNSSPKSPN